MKRCRRLSTAGVLNRPFSFSIAVFHLDGSSLGPGALGGGAVGAVHWEEVFWRAAACRLQMRQE